MLLLAIYTAQWEWKALLKEERMVKAEQAGLARSLRSASEPARPKRRSQPETSAAFDRLLTTLGYAPR